MEMARHVQIAWNMWVEIPPGAEWATHPQGGVIISLPDGELSWARMEGDKFVCEHMERKAPGLFKNQPEPD